MGRKSKQPATIIAGVKIPDELRLLSRQQAAEYLGTGLNLFQGVDAPPAIRIGPKTYRYRIPELLEWAVTQNTKRNNTRGSV